MQPPCYDRNGLVPASVAFCVGTRFKLTVLNLDRSDVRPCRSGLGVDEMVRYFVIMLAHIATRPINHVSRHLDIEVGWEFSKYI